MSRALTRREVVLSGAATVAATAVVPAVPVIAAVAEAPADVLYSDAWFKEASLGWWEEAELRAIVDTLSDLKDGCFDAVTKVG